MKATFIGLGLMAAASVQTGPVGAGAALQSTESTNVALTLECVDQANIRFDVSNVGPNDSALRFGSVLGNGRVITIDGLELELTTPDGQVSERHYFPRHYPGVIGGSWFPWIAALPTHAAYRMSAKAEDFVPRQDRFPSRTGLSLRWTISPALSSSGFLMYWTGTLRSNSCTSASDARSPRGP